MILLFYFRDLVMTRNLESTVLSICHPPMAYWQNNQSLMVILLIWSIFPSKKKERLNAAVTETWRVQLPKVCSCLEFCKTNRKAAETPDCGQEVQSARTRRSFAAAASARREQFQSSHVHCHHVPCSFSCLCVKCDRRERTMWNSQKRQLRFLIL